MKAVKGIRYLNLRSGTYVFRRGVPSYARAQFEGRLEVNETLETGNLTDARARMIEKIADFDARIARARNERAMKDGRPAPRRVPANVEIEEVVRQALADRLGRNELDHLFDSSDNVVEDYKAQLARHAEDVAEGLKRGGSGPNITSIWFAEALIAENGWDIHPNTSAYRHLLRTVARSQREAGYRLTQIIDGAPVKVVDDTFGPDQYRLDAERQRDRRLVPVVPLMSMFDGYVKERKPKPATVRAWRRQITAFIAFVGHDNAGNLEPQDIARWKEHLLNKVSKTGKKLNAYTVKDTYLSAIKTTLAWAKENSHISINPAAGIRVRTTARIKLRDPGLTDAEAIAILSATMLGTHKNLSVERAFARRWVPWLCAYSGARVNEITQMRREDIERRGDMWTMRITPEAGNVKDDKPRVVPLHPHVVEQGFIEAIAKMSGPLFYNPLRKLLDDGEIRQPKKVGEYLAKWVREIGVDDPRVQPNHGWRHRFKSKSWDYGIDARICDKIVGHAPRTVGESYGEISLPVLFNAILQIPKYEIRSDAA